MDKKIKKYISSSVKFHDFKGAVELASELGLGIEISRFGKLREIEENSYNILKEYKKTRVVLSDYKKISTSSQTKMWEFKEITTGILFYFSINENEYAIEVDDDSLRKYLEKYFDI